MRAAIIAACFRRAVLGHIAARSGSYIRLQAPAMAAQLSAMLPPLFAAYAA